MRKCLPLRLLLPLLGFAGLALPAKGQVPCVIPQYISGFVSAPHSPGDTGLNEDRPVQGPDGMLYFTLKGGGAHYNGAIVKVTPAGVMSTVYDFEGTVNPARGRSPSGGLTFGADGHLYGHTSGGGSASKGTLFRCTTAGVVTTLHNFDGTSSSPAPVGALLRASDGNFYGMTRVGGVVSNAGTIFRLTPAGGFTELLAFTGSKTVDSPTEGSWPRGTLVERTEGSTKYVYGVVEESGGTNFGKVFRFVLPAAAAGTVTPQTVVRFTGTTGAYKGAAPRSGLTLATDGALYGVTSQGGAGGYGTLYKITAFGLFSTVFDFGANLALAGGEPNSAPWQGADGYLYGTVARNGGGVYRISTGGTNASVLTAYSAGGPMGQATISLMQHSGGDLYGLSEQGGPRNRGVLFRLHGSGSAWTTATAVEFGLRSSSLEGSYPNGTLVSDNGIFYGTTEQGGNELNSGRGYGTIFSMTYTGQRTTLVSFTNVGAVPGYWPRAGLLRTPDGVLYGTASGGGTDGKGTLFRYKPATAEFTSLAYFSGTAAAGAGAKGELPTGLLADGADGYVYGTTRFGGSANAGTVFRIGKNGGAVQTLAEFTGTSGAKPGGEPACGLTGAYSGSFQPATAFYGVTTRGGSQNQGTLFRITPGGAFTTLAQFTGGTGPVPGAEPSGQLTWKDDWLYGTTFSGGGFGYGTIFRFNPVTNEFNSLVALGSTAPGTWHGRSPLAGLTLASDGLLYGTTSTGLSESGNGTLFRLEAGNALSPVAVFSGLDMGALLPGKMPPPASLGGGEDNDLYGITYDGGPGNGTVFKLNLGAKVGTLQPVNLGNGNVRLRGVAVPNGTNVQFGFEITPIEEVQYEPYTYRPAGTSNTTREFFFDDTGYIRGATYLIRAVLSGPCGSIISAWVEYTPASVYGSWKTQYFAANDDLPAIAGDAADPDRDGVPNLAEFMTGTSPVAQNSTPVTAVITTANNQRRLSFSYFRRENGDAGETLAIQTSTDLINWQSLAAASGTEQKSAGPVGNGEPMVFRWEGSIPVSGTARRYVRLRATRP